jgi:hypothetical protein
MLEIKTALASFVRRFTFELDLARPMKTHEHLTLHPSKESGMHVFLTPRKAPRKSSVF